MEDVNNQVSHASCTESADMMLSGMMIDDKSQIPMWIQSYSYNLFNEKIFSGPYTPETITKPQPIVQVGCALS